jgi:hypothetical protein
MGITATRILNISSANAAIGYGSGKNIFRVETEDGMIERGINNFQADEKRGIIYTFFAVLTVLIACLGLFGLESFVYRADIKWTTFLLAALVTILITLVTVSLQTIREGNLNPAESLRNE